jgi:DNA polymerase V
LWFSRWKQSRKWSCSWQLNLFSNNLNNSTRNKKEKEQQKEELILQRTLIDIKNKYGKNAILKGMNLEEGVTTIDRNGQVGGHKGFRWNY